ncbi:MAG: hypothetical protein H5T98_10505 [Syntrophomonadaceae bacterium]|nr:hypothetical protein [Syntrophomonadaceae bacterium]
MEKAVIDYVASLELGELQAHENMAVVPLFSPVKGGPSYVTMKEALEGGFLQVTEIGEEGSVPELKVRNSGDKPVLLLDGEELSGAKQNRVLNTTILVPARAEVIIPVSCTEAGRWHYTSREFVDSGNILASQARREKVRSVTRNLQCIGAFHSDQGRVWENIDEMVEATAVSSPTQAMSDVFESKAADLEDYLAAFACLPGQRGMLVMVNGEAIGLDMLSLAPAYEVLHPKLLKSYAMEAILSRKPRAPKASLKNAEAFIATIPKCEERKYKSVGMGWDYRFEGENAVGSALVYRKKVVHMAFFKTEAAERAGRIADFRTRRGHRVY